MLLVLKWSFYVYSDMVKSILQLKRIAIETIAYYSQFARGEGHTGQAGPQQENAEIDGRQREQEEHPESRDCGFHRQTKQA